MIFACKKKERKKYIVSMDSLSITAYVPRLGIRRRS
jgi:hypothetical protein